MSNFSGKQVLLIAPQFFGYEIEIANGIRSQGASVDFLPDRIFNSPLMRGVTRLRREWVLPFTDRLFLNSVEAFGRSRYDVIFVVVGEGLSEQVLSSLRAAFPSTPFVLYMWDALRNRRGLERNLRFFDTCHTFDQNDATLFGMTFRPLFFAPGFARASVQEHQYQLSFVGTAHSDRYKVVSQVTSALPKQARYYWYLYLQAHWIFWAHKLGNPAFRGAAKESFSFVPMAKAAVQDVFFNSLAILDIEHPRQTGLTMRTFETMGSNKKLITTNNQVKEMDFFNSQNILVIDRGSVPTIPDNFLNTPYVPLSKAIYEKYSLAGWLRDVVPAGVFTKNQPTCRAETSAK